MRRSGSLLLGFERPLFLDTMSMTLLMCFMMCFTYVFKRKKVFDIWSDIFYITQNLESCQEVIRMHLSPQASCLKTKKATSLPASHWKHFTLTFRGHFQGCLFVKATENQLHHIKSGKKTKVSLYCGTLSANQLQVSKRLKYAVHDFLLLPSTVKTSFAHFWPPRCRWLA